MERSPADEAMASDVAVAELPFSSGAHWANRDSTRHTGEQAMFRRPPAAASSFDEDETKPWDAFAAGSGEQAAHSGRPAFTGEQAAHSGRPAFTGEQPAYSGRPAFTGEQPAVTDEPRLSDTGTRSRASFGMTDEPISGNWAGRDPSPVSPAAPTAPMAAVQAPVQPEPIAVELPVRMAAEPDGYATGQWQTQMPLSREPQQSYQPGYPAPEYAAADHPAGDYAADHAAGDYAAAGYGVPDYAAAPAEAGAGFFDESHAHEIRAHRAAAAGHGHGPGHHQQIPPRRSKALAVATVTLSAVVLLGGVAAGVRYFSGDDKGIGSVLQLGNEVPADTAAKAPLGNRTSATFELVAATRKATVRTQDLGDDLYRITAAGDSGASPRPALTGDKVQLLLETDGPDAAARGDVQILLSDKVTWALLFTGGADEQVVDLTGAKLSAIDVNGASRRVRMTLPKPDGTVPVRITGAIDDLSMLTGSPVRVRVDGGVKTVSAGTRTLKDLKPGSTLTPKDWKAADRYDVSAESRLTQLTVRDPA
ncbi:hypothetical protein [Actinoplanes sp. NPDC049265]|uniref:hypothetical protein n=1 Tax=Actinoplanes sp. NPDC049265 TaxID=3363902 RepID=UPI00371E7426